MEMIYPKFKIGDLVRSKWRKTRSTGFGIVLPAELVDTSPETYYLIYHFESNERIWAHARDWELIE